jgi:flagellar hook-associated protein 2
MSTLGINTTGSTTTPAPTGTLSSLGGGTPLQITGLASGLDTNQIISELMSIQQQPVTNLQKQSSGITALNSQLTSIQTMLQTVAADAQALGNQSLFSNAQTVSSSVPSAVSASTSTGAGVGGYQVGVTQLANSAQRTFSFTSPTAADTVTIDGVATTIAAGATAQDFANAINSNSSSTVYAAATGAGTVVMSSRATGTTGSAIQPSETTTGASALSEQTSLARPGKDAAYTIDGVSGSSHTNTVTGAIAGVTLTFGGLTTTTGSATINVSAPAPSTSNITTAVQKFVTDYNSAIGQIGTQLSQLPSSTDPTQGTLNNDSGLTDLLNSMRQAMYASASGLSSGMQSMLDLGVSTGATSGGAAPSASALAGDLTINQTTFTNAVQSNPTGVQSMLEGFASSFSSLVNSEAQPGGSIDSRIQGDSSQITSLASQISNMQASLTDQQAQLTAQFALLESTLSQNQSMSTWLTSQIAALPTA